jgi:hypothetical protein
MIDLRFRVVDPAKAAPLVKRGAKQPSFLVHEASGRTLSVPSTKVGTLRQMTHDPKAGRIYFSLFDNPEVAKPGDRLTLVIGGSRFPGLRLDAPAKLPWASRQLSEPARSKAPAGGSPVSCAAEPP